MWAKLVVALDPEELADACTHAISALRDLLHDTNSRTITDAASIIIRLEMARMRHGFGASLPADDDTFDDADDDLDDLFDADEVEDEFEEEDFA
ncbi:MAG TPA: hypothetical protein VMZ71_08065, partial [Gemmataceae bacterium]|nr:hypothetical protein [Gemmataceae bacterium]